MSVSLFLKKRARILESVIRHPIPRNSHLGRFCGLLLEASPRFTKEVHRGPLKEDSSLKGGPTTLPCYCNLLKPRINILFLMVPYGYSIIKIKKTIPKEMTG